MQGHIVIPPNLFQIGEAGDDCCLLAPEGQVDEILDPTDPELYRRCLELRRLLICKTVQPLCQIVQLIQIDAATLQPFEDGVGAVHFADPAVLPHSVPQLQRLHLLQNGFILIGRDWEGDGCLTIFFMILHALDF